MHQSENIKIKLIIIRNKDEYSWLIVPKVPPYTTANSTVCQSKWKPIVEPRRAKPKTYRQAPTHWLKFYEEAVIESEARTAVVQLKSEA